MAEPQTLQPEDYQQLFGMLMSPEGAQRDQGQALAKKLTPDEQRTFFTFQQQQNPGAERHRPDNSLLGVPPELAVTSAVGLGRAVAGAGLTAAGRVAAGAKNITAQATPVLKYEATKAALEHMGMPAPIAIPIAMAVAGYNKGAKVPTPTAVAPETEAAASVASRVEPVASPRAVPAAQDVPVSSSGPAPTSAAVPASPRVVMSPQRIQNDLGLAARRAKVTLTEPQYQQAAELVQAGKAPLEAVQAVASGTPPTPATPAAAVPAVPQKLVLKNASELNEYVRLTKSGLTPAEASTAIVQQRQLLQKFGTPSTEDVIRKVVDRNTTGRWQK